MRKYLSLKLSLILTLALLAGAVLPATAAPVQLQPSYERYSLGTSLSRISLLSTGPLVSLNNPLEATRVDQATMEKAFSEYEVYQHDGGFFFVMAARAQIREELWSLFNPETFDYTDTINGSLAEMKRSGLTVLEQTEDTTSVSGRNAVIAQVLGEIQGTRVGVRILAFFGNRTLWCIVVLAPDAGSAGDEALTNIIDSVRIEE